MTTLILRNTTPADKRRLPRNFHSYVAIDKERGANIADIEWTYRPKNAGGPAYKASVEEPGRIIDNQRVSVYSKDLKKLCEIVRYIYTREGEAPRHWR